MVPAETNLPIKGTVVTGAIDINASILAIKDPYEQCLAYTKLKKITDVDCKVKVDMLKKKQEQKMQAEENDRQKDMKVIATAWKKPDNTTQSNIKESNGAYMNIPAVMEDYYKKILDNSGVQLTPEQQQKIIQALNAQLTSAIMDGKFDQKKYGSFDEIKELEKFKKMGEIKEIRQEAKKEIKEIRTTQKSDIKSKQEAMRKLLKEKKEAMKNKIPTQTNTNQ
jgi:hypothetical protein